MTAPRSADLLIVPAGEGDICADCAPPALKR